MNQRYTILAYAHLVAAEIPLACAKRLRFDCAADYHAVLADLAVLSPVGYPGRQRDIAFFRTAADALALFEEKMPTNREEHAAETARRHEAFVPLYRALAPLVPMAADTPWSHPSLHQWSRTFGGWSLTVSYRTKTAARWGSRGSPATYTIRAEAPGADGMREELPTGSSIAQAKKHIESWVAVHDLHAERMRALGGEK